MNEDVNQDERPDWLDAGLRGLPREIAPGRDLWPGIEARLGPRSRRRSMPRLLVAAVAASLFLGVVAVVLAVRPERAIDEGVVTRQTIEALRAPYLDARLQYASAWAARRETLDPELVAVIERNLRIIRTAQDEIDRALATAPDSVALHDLLRTTYASELDLYRRAQALDVPTI